MTPKVDPRFLTIDTHVIRGVRRWLNTAAPAAGAEWVATVPNGRMWRLLAAQATLTTAVAAANRLAGIQVKSQGFTTFVNQNLFAIIASQADTIVYQQGTSMFFTANIGTVVPVIFVPTWLLPTDTIGSLTTALQAADAYTAINLMVEEAFFEPTLLTISYEARARAIGDGYDDQLSDFERIHEPGRTWPRG